jgi:toxin FitB
MCLVDSSGWIEYFLNGPAAERYAKVLAKPNEILTPSIVLYEVYKKVKKESDQNWALAAADQMEKTHVVELSSSIAYQAADCSIEYGLAMADALIYTTARFHKAELVTSDADFKTLPGVRYLSSQS